MRLKIGMSLLSLILIASCSSKKQSSLEAADVIRMINTYQTDSLAAVMDKAFIMDFDYIAFQGTKANFLEETMPNSKALGARYEIVEAKKPVEGKSQYIVKDISAFEDYLKIEPAKMMLTIVINDSSRLEKIYMDSLPGYHRYNTDLSQKMVGFMEWLEKAHPEENMAKLMEDQSGRIKTRLKEYSEQVK